MKYIIVFCTLALFTLSCGDNASKQIVGADIHEEARSIYTTDCASCHGAKMEMFTDRKWKNGNEKEALVSSISDGYPDLGMPSFDSLFTAEQISKLAAYIRSGIDGRAEYSFEESFNADSTFESDGVRFKLELITDEVGVPWGFVFLPDTTMLITGVSGKLFHKNLRNDQMVEIAGLPKVVHEGQGGLLDIELDPDFSANKRCYISYSKGKGDEATTAVVSAIFSKGQLTEIREIFEALPYLPTKHHYGGRLEFDAEGLLYISVGDRGRRNELPQTLNNHCGKVHRIHSDGSIPSDNPFVGQEGAKPSIYSYGHRNPQGLSYDKDTKIMWEHEHGPRGGDELNILQSGKNYGWPVVSFGINYNGTTFTNETSRSDMIDSEKYWVPSIAPCGMAIVKSDQYPAWQNDLLVASLRFQYLNKVKSDYSEVSMLKNIGRMRNVRLDNEGYIYVSTEEPGAIYKLIPQS